MTDKPRYSMHPEERETTPPGSEDLDTFRIPKGDEEPTGKPIGMIALQKMAVVDALRKDSMHPIPSGHEELSHMEIQQDKTLLAAIIRGEMGMPQAGPILSAIIKRRGVDGTIGMAFDLHEIELLGVNRRIDGAVADVRALVGQLVKQGGIPEVISEETRINQLTLLQFPPIIMEARVKIMKRLQDEDISPVEERSLTHTLQRLDDLENLRSLREVRALTDHTSGTINDLHTGIKAAPQDADGHPSFTTVPETLTALERCFYELHIALVAYASQPASSEHFSPDLIRTPEGPIGYGHMEMPDPTLVANLDLNPQVSQTFVEIFVQNMAHTSENLHALNVHVHKMIATTLQHFGRIFRGFDFGQKHIAADMIATLEGKGTLSQRLTKFHALLTTISIAKGKEEHLAQREALMRFLERSLKTIVLSAQVCNLLEETIKKTSERPPLDTSSDNDLP